MDFLYGPVMARPSIAAWSRNCPQGARAATEAQGSCLLLSPAPGGDAQDQRAIRVPFGFFLLGKQKKEARPRGETRSKTRRRQRRLPFPHYASRDSDWTSDLKTL